MTTISTVAGLDGTARDPSLAATHRHVIDRLADPYLTDHDRWVLGQFASFLDGKTPDPDPRVTRTPAQRPLFSRVRRATL
jgi:hypothetical protein